MSAEPGFRMRPDDISSVYVRSRNGDMVPLSSLVTVRYTSGPDSLERFNNLPAVKIIGQAAPGIQLGPGDRARRADRGRSAAADFSFDWGGTCYQEKRSGGASTFALVLAVIMVFLILAAQYERWSLPLSVLFALPFGTFGALAAVCAARHDQRRLLPDRPRDAARPRGEERDPDRRVRGATRHEEGLSPCGGRGRGGAAALPADPDDVARVHPRRAAARDLDRRGRRRAALGRHRRHGRHAGRDVPRDLLRAAVLQGHLRAPALRAAHARRSSWAKSTTRISTRTSVPHTPGHPPRGTGCETEHA